MNRIGSTIGETGKALVWKQDSAVNWSMTERSPCYVFKARDVAEIMQVLTAARTRGLSVIAHGAGHSYTDAALNTNEIIIDVTEMRRILSWDPEQGIMQVEPGVTLRDVVRVALADRLVASCYTIHCGCYYWRLCCYECEWEKCLEIWLFWRTLAVCYCAAG